MKLSKSEQLQFLDNDVAILETMFASQDGHWLELDGKYMPDGEVFRVSLEGVKEMTGELRRQLVETVRGQYDARESEQNAEKESNKRARQAADRGENPDPGDTGRGAVAAPPPVQEHQASIQETLNERQGILAEELAALDEARQRAEQEYAELYREYEEVCLCIDALQKRSPSESGTRKRKAAKKEPSGGSTTDGRKASPRKTERKSDTN